MVKLLLMHFKSPSAQCSVQEDIEFIGVILSTALWNVEEFLTENDTALEGNVRFWSNGNIQVQCHIYDFFIQELIIIMVISTLPIIVQGQHQICLVVHCV
jgi:hypothetical protein